MKETRPLGIVYSSIYGAKYGRVSPDDGASHIANSNNFIKGIFPVSNSGVLSKNGADLKGASSGFEGIDTALNIVAVALERTVVDRTARNVIGIVPQGYFASYNDEGAVGVSFSEPANAGLSDLSPSASLVEECYWTTTGHEIAHTFGFRDRTDDGFFSAFWIDLNFLLPDSSNLMSGVGRDLYKKYSGNTGSVWIKDSEYSTLFKSLLGDLTDPEVLVISGTVSKSGVVTLQPMYFFPDGVATRFSPDADGTVSALGPSGAIEAQSSFASSFDLVTSNGNLIPSETTAFLVQLPAPKSAATVQISRNGKSLVTIDPNTKLLSDAVDGIVNTSFRKNQKEGRKQLSLRVDEIEKTIGDCHKLQKATICNTSNPVEECYQHAVGHILSLRNEVDRVLNDSNDKTDPLDFVKSDVLRVIDNVALFLIPNRVVRLEQGTSTIKILPRNENFRDSEIFNILSLTQGQYGTVSFDDHGNVIYKPAGAARNDAFAVTIRNIDGTTSVKTITVNPTCHRTPCLNSSSAKAHD